MCLHIHNIDMSQTIILTDILSVSHRLVNRENRSIDNTELILPKQINNET